MGGWIRLYRSIRDNWLFERSDYLLYWIDLLMMANYTEKKWPKNDQLILIKKGEMITSIVRLSERWKCSRNKIIRFLTLLEKDRMIVRESDTHYTRLSICNYERYQGGGAYEGTTKGQPGGQPGGRQRDITKEYKEVKNVRKEYSPAFYMMVWNKIYERFGLDEMRYSGYTGLIIKATERLGEDNIMLCVDRFLSDSKSAIKSIHYFLNQGIDGYMVDIDPEKVREAKYEQLFDN